MTPARDWPRGSARAADIQEGATYPTGPGSAGKPGVVSRLDENCGDRYDNLILLCRDHQSAADNTSGVSPAERRARIKAEHEEWVRRSPLAEHPTGSSLRYDPRYQGVTLLPRVRRGEALVALIGGAHSIQHDRDDADRLAAEELVGGFVRYIQGLTDLWEAYGPAERSRVAEHLDRQIEALESEGWLLFAIRYIAEAVAGGATGTWSILRMWILCEGPREGLCEGADSGPANG